jgi:hypothetical protein
VPTENSRALVELTGRACSGDMNAIFLDEVADALLLAGLGLAMPKSVILTRPAR